MNKHVLGLATTPLVVAGLAGAMASPVFADETGTLVECDNLQQTINEAADSAVTFISLSNDCAKDITIPAGKRIALGTYQGSVLSSLERDTITVEEGATLYLKGGSYKNSFADRAIVNNAGLTVVDFDRSVGVGASAPHFITEADTATWVINNSGEMNILSAVVDNEFNIVNSGTLRIQEGGTNIDEERISSYLVSGRCADAVLINNNWSMPKYVPVGFNMTTTIWSERMQDDAMCGRHIYSTDSDTVEVTGVASSSGLTYSMEAKKAGVVDVHEDLWENVNSVPVTAYELKSNVPELAENSFIVNYIGQEYGRYFPGTQKNNLILALEDGEDISVDLTIDELKAEDVDEEKATVIKEALGDGKVIGYGDINLAINASESGLIEKITLLGGCTASAAGINCVEDPIDVKWGGLELGEAAEGYERNFYVIRVHDGEAKKIAAEVDEDGNLVFPSGRFSTYVAVYEDVEIAPEDESEGSASDATDASTPDTGVETHSSTNNVLSLIGCIVAGIALALVMLPKIRKYLEGRKA